MSEILRHFEDRLFEIIDSKGQTLDDCDLELKRAAEKLGIARDIDVHVFGYHASPSPDQIIAMAEFGHVTCRVVGSPDKGFNIEHYPNSERFSSYKSAERAGWRMYDSDDFYIAEYENDKCVAVFKYVDDNFEAGEQRITDDEEIYEVNRVIQAEEGSKEE